MQLEWRNYYMAKQRQIAEQIQRVQGTKSGRIIVLTGARQVGKTTLVKNVLKDYTYISIEDPVMRPSYLGLNSAQWSKLYPKAALDEVQKEPQLIESIKAVYDQYDQVSYVLLGSSQILLLDKVKESLAGRCSIFDMYPLTLPEMQTESWYDKVKYSLWQTMLMEENFQCDFYPSFLLDSAMVSKQQAWEFYLTYGAYPALVDENMSKEERWQWLANYVRTYLERDIRDLAVIRDLEPFVKLQQAIALQTSQTINLSSLAVRVGVSAKTVQRYLDYLILSYQAILLPAWDRNENKRISKSPKVHLLDYGVLQSVLQKRGGITGAEFESAVVAELYKQAKNILSPARFYHFRTHDGKEVDLLVELPQGYMAFEIKMSEHVQKTDARHLKDLEDILDKPLIHAFVLSNDVITSRISDKISMLNAAMFLG